MSDWASRRKSIILGVLALVLLALAVFVFWKFWFKAPSCFDNVQNGDETGIDCGGSCVKVCSGGAMRPIVLWDPRLFEVASGTWNALVYIENQNIDLEAIYLPYTLTIFDEKNQILEKREKATILPKNKTVGVFEGSILEKNGAKPKRAIFEIGDGVVWKKNEDKGNVLSVSNGPLLRAESQPRIEANVKNNSTSEIKNIELVVAIFDNSDNVIAASRTFIDRLKKDENTNIFFTWPKPFELSSRVCEKPSDIIMVLDRSGSMALLKKIPPEPLTSAKVAAISFVKQLNQGDKIGLISFAGMAKDPIDLNLSSDFSLAQKTIESINIEASSTQYTNIYDALHSARQELISARAEEGASKIIILLTDGVANNPKNPQGRTEADDIKYAETAALKEAVDIKKDGMIVYTIGLGNQINDQFLRTVASKQEDYFFAPTVADLEGIYKNISSDICKEKAAKIEITYKIFGDLK